MELDDVVTLQQAKQFYNNLTGADEGIKRSSRYAGLGMICESRVSVMQSFTLLQWLARFLFQKNTGGRYFVYHKQKMLLIKRSRRVGAHRVVACSGRILVPGKIFTQARQELREEVGWSARYSFDAPWDSTTPVDEKVQRVWVVNRGGTELYQ